MRYASPETTRNPKAADDSAVQQTKNYFIHSLFTRVMIPDRGLAGLSREVRRRRLLLRMAACAKDKGKTLQGATVLLMEAYSENKFLAGKEVMRAQTHDGTFQFPRSTQPPGLPCVQRSSRC